MRVLRSQRKRPLDLLAVGAGGHVAAACSLFEVRGEVEVWEVASGALALAHPRAEREYFSLAFHPDGRHLLVTESVDDYGNVSFYAVAPGMQFRKLWSDGRRRYLLYGEPAVSPDGSRTAVSMHDGFRDRVRNVVQLRDPQRGKVLAEIDFG